MEATAIPSDIMSRFQIFLDRKPVPKQLQAHYKKWFRYYWDFCHKYGPAFKLESLHLFLDKLRQKKQTEFQIQQASDAISLYSDLGKHRLNRNAQSLIIQAFRLLHNDLLDNHKQKD